MGDIWLNRNPHSVMERSRTVTSTEGSLLLGFPSLGKEVVIKALLVKIPSKGTLATIIKVTVSCGANISIVHSPVTLS